MMMHEIPAATVVDFKKRILQYTYCTVNVNNSTVHSVTVGVTVHSVKLSSFIMLAPRKKLWSTPIEVMMKAIDVLQPSKDDILYDIGQ